jgi:hypothetical protein
MFFLRLIIKRDIVRVQSKKKEELMEYEEFKKTECWKYLNVARHDFRHDATVGQMLFADLYYIYYMNWHKEVVELYDLFQKDDFEAIKKIYNYEESEIIGFSCEEIEDSFLVLLDRFMNEHAELYLNRSQMNPREFVDCFDSEEEFEESKHLYKDLVEDYKDELEEKFRRLNEE